jgi:glycosyltransferase involved in cell wall biosynthesis
MNTAPSAAGTRKVCLLAYWDMPSALPPMFNHAVSLAAAGFDVEMICLAPQSAAAVREAPVSAFAVTRLHIRTRRAFFALLGGATLHRSLTALQYGFSYVEFVAKALAAALRSRADVYEANDLPPLLPAVVAAKLRGKPVVYRAHELWSEAAPRVRFARFWRLMERSLVPRCDYVITPEEHRSRIYEEELGAKRPALTVRNCPPYRTPIESTRLREELTRRGTRWSTIALYQGLVDSMRCVEEIAEASRFFDDGVVLVIIGSGFGQWANPAAALASYERIVVLPPVRYEDLLPYTASADMGILLYRNDCRNNYYCAPNKLFEYMMMGLPMIAADYPGMKSLVEGEGVGICVDSSSPQAIAAAVNRLAADPDGRTRMKARGLQLSRERYNWAIESTALLRLYRGLASADAS